MNKNNEEFHHPTDVNICISTADFRNIRELDNLISYLITTGTFKEVKIDTANVILIIEKNNI